MRFYEASSFTARAVARNRQGSGQVRPKKKATAATGPCFGAFWHTRSIKGIANGGRAPWGVVAFVSCVLFGRGGRATNPTERMMASKRGQAAEHQDRRRIGAVLMGRESRALAWSLLGAPSVSPRPDSDTDTIDEAQERRGSHDSSAPGPSAHYLFSAQHSESSLSTTWTSIAAFTLHRTFPTG